MVVYAARGSGVSHGLSHNAVDVLILVLIAIIADEMAVEVHERFTVTAGNLPLLLAVMFLGQLPAMIVAAIVGLWGGWRENSRAVVAFNCATFVICAFLASAAFSFLESRFSIPLDTVTLSLLAAGAVAAAVYEGLNYLLTSVAGYVKYDISLATYWREGMPAQLVQSLAVVGGLGVAVAALYATAGITARCPSLHSALR